MTNIIKVENISKIYKRNKKNFLALKDITFSVCSGEIIGVIGKNGAGKSTLIKLLSGILLADKGKIIIDGFNPFEQRKKIINKIGVLFGQKSQLIWDLKVKESFLLTKYIYKIDKENYSSILEFLLKNFEVRELMEVPVKELSLGQRMKCEIINTILPLPKILYLDEPTLGLDILSKNSIQKIIQTLNQKYNITIILTSHDLNEIEKVCNRIIIIDEGKMIYDASIFQIKENYNNFKRIDFSLKEGVIFKVPNSLKDKVKFIQEHKKISLSFNLKNIPLNCVVSEILNFYEIEDLIINEKTIEDIILEIYKEENL
ncbi:ATP-binding cassette domain-containing protein [Fusobacterium nucleatum]|uniref:ABC transporter ATP-binding protein n=1 Tax=Fusobacterium nucleatum TaxID=851 RepID=UPI0030D0B90B